MRFRVGSNSYFADFSFSKETPRTTVCMIGVQEEENSKLLAEGVAVCSPRDNFNKATGKKLALLRALKRAEFTKDQRKSVWEQYFQTNKMV